MQRLFEVLFLCFTTKTFQGDKKGLTKNEQILYPLDLLNFFLTEKNIKFTKLICLNNDKTTYLLDFADVAVHFTNFFLK